MEAPRARSVSVRRRRSLRLGLGAAVAALLIAVAAVMLTGDDADERADGGGATVAGPPGREFTLLRPDGWRELSAEERAELEGEPLAVLRRGEDEGLVIVNAPAGPERDLDAISRRLDARLKKELPDFRKVAARVVRVEAGRALLYSYARTRKGTAHTVLVVPARERTYTLNAVVPAGADDAAREVGRILRSFDL